MKLVFILIMVSLLLVACSSQSEVANGPFLQSVQIREDSAASEISVGSSNPIPIVSEPVLDADPAGSSDSIPVVSEPVLDADPVEAAGQKTWPDEDVRYDRQGFVEVAVAPINLNNATTSLNFEVSLNTHSVDLSMDLASLATLDADNGKSVKGALWDAPRGGHHVAGILSFPADVDGFVLLENATQLTLTIRDVDAPERVFVWDVSQ